MANSTSVGYLTLRETCLRISEVLGLAMLGSARYKAWSVPSCGKSGQPCGDETVLGRVASNDAVAASLVEYQHQRGHRVLDGRPAELGLPLVDRAVNQACGDHPDLKMTERRCDGKTEAG
jgi:hypothetical protein